MTRTCRQPYRNSNKHNTMKGINIFLADGFEDTEALATNDVLRRGGLQTRLISISNEPFVQSSHGVTVSADEMLLTLDTGHDGTTGKDIMIFPGGMPGSTNLAQCRQLIELMNRHYDAGGSLAAICAAPGLVISQLKDLGKISFTCFEGFQDALVARGAEYLTEPAVRCGRIITGRSAGHAVSFALEILRFIKGDEAADAVHHAMYLY